ncbi:hypothetical protein [Vulcanisaeta sp. JCM 16159]|uniref:hypothetical protein n=1 Tax=Vulcanisaeta sp. JCM 16159 TaxID=1295371 RepID=UPI0006CFD608|nr:hypothetical protein [Vulcanisaeta sp. JCM 16159]
MNRLGNWWYYTETTTKVLIIALIALLIIIIISPHLGPLQPIAKALGLVEIREIYNTINNTSGTVCTPKYVNQVTPIYINKTIFIPMNNVVSGETWWNYTGYLMGTGWCWGKILVMHNDTAWFITTWIIPDWLLQKMGLSTCSTGCYNFSLPYGLELMRPVYLPMYLPINGSTSFFPIYGMSYVAVSNETMNYPYPGFTVIIIGDVTGHGPIPVVQVLNISGNYVILSALSFNTTLALNTTYYGYLALTNLPANFSSYISYIVPCSSIYFT